MRGVAESQVTVSLTNHLNGTECVDFSKLGRETCSQRKQSGDFWNGLRKLRHCPEDAQMRADGVGKEIVLSTLKLCFKVDNTLKLYTIIHTIICQVNGWEKSLERYHLLFQGSYFIREVVVEGRAAVSLPIRPAAVFAVRSIFDPN